MDYEFNKYVTDINNLKDMLNLYGVAIIPNVLYINECNKINEGIWDFFEYITKDWKGKYIPINRNNKKTWASH